MGKTRPAVQALIDARRAAGGPRLPGRPRKDGLPPIQRKKLAAQTAPTANLSPDEIKALRELVARIRYLAGRGMPLKYIAALTRVPVTDFETGGRFAEDIEIGKAEAALAVMEATYTRVIEGKTIETLFWLKCNAGWAETASARKKMAEDEDDNEISEIELKVVK